MVIFILEPRSPTKKAPLKREASFIKAPLISPRIAGAGLSTVPELYAYIPAGCSASQGRSLCQSG